MTAKSVLIALAFFVGIAIVLVVAVAVVRILERWGKHG